MRALPLAALLLVTLLVAIPSDPATEVAAAQEDPELQHFRQWSIGDHWSWRKETAAASNANTKGEITHRVQSVERVTNSRFFDPEKFDARWESHQVFRVKVWANQTSNSPYGPALIKTEQERYYRTADLGLAQNHAVSRFLFSQDPAQNGGQERYHEYFPPQLEMTFPFTLGDKWRVATVTRNHNPGNDCGGEGMPPCNTSSHKVHTYTVLRTENLRLTIDGTSREFFTYVVHVNDDLGIEDAKNPELKKYALWWWSPEVCNMVKKEEYSARRTLQEVWTLTDFHCKGRDAADPNYDIYDFENFSSLRLHGKLAVPERLELYQDMLENRNDGGNLIQLGENLPAPGSFLVVGALVALAAAVRRRPA